MHIKQGQIVKNLSPTESVLIEHIQPLGKMYSLKFTGINSNRVSTKVITEEDIKQLEVVTEGGVFNFSGDPRKFGLFAEAERIHSAYQFDPLFAVNCSIVDPLPHQVEAVYKFLLPLPKIRFLLADDTGAGKTIMTGLLIKELLMRGLIERVLIVTPGGLTKQWHEDEMGVKFNLSFDLVNRSRFSSDPNVFHHANRIVTSIDFISREEVLNVAQNAHWDLIVFDECHKLSAYDYGNKQYLSQRYKAAQSLAQQCEHLLLLTATPHRGRSDTFKKLLQLLDEDIFATTDLASNQIKKLEKDGINRFFIRRLKENMQDWEGQPLFKQRFTKTVAYELTPEEKILYDAVTAYLSVKKEEASQSNNIHVSLALTVMQRRLVSSIFAIKNTLEKRWKALQGIADEVQRNPSLWKQRHKLDAFDVCSLDDFEELEDTEREALENILSDPRKFKLFTTAESIEAIKQEAKEVKDLYQMAENLYQQNQTEKKFKELEALLVAQQVIDGQKLVIFTEHKDTLLYLEKRLKKSGGYGVVTIHGGKSVDERRQAQWAFAKPETQILIATDAAGEGINLQFCRLLINWDIPWNPNRLEQRMGRIHRYGQKQDVLVFNLVASNTKEGKVLEKLLTKLDVIREEIGDDRVYDVIQDVFEGISLDHIMNSVLYGKQTDFNDMIEQTSKEKIKEKIDAQSNALAHSKVGYQDAKQLKENSDEKRLQPIYIRLFFEKIFKILGGTFKEIRPSIYQINEMPQIVVDTLRHKFNLNYDALKGILFCFDKQIFLEYQNLSDLGKIHYINPGNPIFDALVKVAREQFKEDMLKGTVLISPEDKFPYLAYFLKSEIVDNRTQNNLESIADERLYMICQDQNDAFTVTSPAKFIDLHPPQQFVKPVTPPQSVNPHEVIEWSFENLTLPQLEETKSHAQKDVTERKNYLQTAFTRVIADTQIEIESLQSKLLKGDAKAEEKILKKQEQIQNLIQKRNQRLANLERMLELNPKAPEVLGAAYVVPLSQLEYKGHYGMSRDDEAEQVAMQIAIDYELQNGRTPVDVSANNEGYDIKSTNQDLLKRYIEVKGRSGADGSVMISENEMNRLAQLGNAAWLYIVLNCKSMPQLFTLQNPAQNLEFQKKSKGIQYFLPFNAWKENPLIDAIPK